MDACSRGDVQVVGIAGNSFRAKKRIIFKTRDAFEIAAVPAKEPGCGSGPELAIGRCIEGSAVSAHFAGDQGKVLKAIAVIAKQTGFRRGPDKPVAILMQPDYGKVCQALIRPIHLERPMLRVDR